MNPVLEKVQDLLVDVDYPASKDQLLEAARSRGGDDEALRALRAMPPVDYGSAEEVLRSLDVDPSAGSPGNENLQARDNQQAGRADHMTQTDETP